MLDLNSKNKLLILNHLFLLRKVDNLSEELRFHFNEMLSIIDHAGSSDDERDMALNTAVEILNSVK